MSVQPFTPAGVTAKTTELYALSKTLLEAEADAVADDFKTWIKSNFSLDSTQSSFLTGINEHAANYYGAQCSVAFRSKLPVSLTVNGVPTPPSPKWLKSEDTLAVSTKSSGELVTTGTLSFIIEYHV